MKIFGRFLLIALIGSLIIICSASAQIIEEKSGYIVRSGYDVEKTAGFPSLESVSLSLYSITEGESNYHSHYVGTGKTSLIYDVDWDDSGNDLGLMIGTPMGVYMGYYHDSMDGVTDGRIYLQILNGGGIEAGTWESKVRGFSVSGTEYYDLSVTAS